MALLAESHDSSYLSGANDTTATSTTQGNNDISVGGMASAWTSPSIRPQATAGTSTSLSSSGGPLTSPLSPSSPVQLPAPSPSSSLQNPPPSYHQYAQYPHVTQQQLQPSPSPSLSASPSTQKPKKERHPFGGMSASSFLTETLPATGLKLYPGSRKGAKSHGDLLSNAGSHSKGKKSGSGLSSINTSKKQLSPGGRLSGNERAYSSSTSNISSPMTGTHDMTSPTSMSRNHHSSLDARVMAREMSQGHSTEDVWQALCIKVLTLFNGQGLTGAVEDLNELVRYASTTMSDS